MLIYILMSGPSFDNPDIDTPIRLAGNNIIIGKGEKCELRSNGNLGLDLSDPNLFCSQITRDNSVTDCIGLDIHNKLVRSVKGSGGGGGDVFLAGPNTFGASCINTYPFQNVHSGVGSSVSFGTDTNVILNKSIIPTNDAKYVVTNGAGELIAGIPKIPIADVDGLVSDLTFITGSISTNTNDITTINTVTLPPMLSDISTNSGSITTLNTVTLPPMIADISANGVLATDAVSKYSPNTVGATNTWSGDNTWSKAGGNLFIHDIEIGSGVALAGRLHLEDDRITLYCGGGTKSTEIDCNSAEFYGSVSMGFGGQISHTIISNSGQSIGNTVGFTVNTDTLFNESLTVGTVGDAYQTVINSDAVGLGGKGFLVNSNHVEMNGAIINLGDLSDTSALINCYSKLHISAAGLHKDLDPFAPTVSTAAGTRGDITWGLDTTVIPTGINYLYICVASNKWGRVELQTTGW